MAGDETAIQNLDPALRSEVLDLIENCGPLSSAQTLALVDLAIPALRGMQLAPETERKILYDNAAALFGLEGEN